MLHFIQKATKIIETNNSRSQWNHSFDEMRAFITAWAPNSNWSQSSMLPKHEKWKWIHSDFKKVTYSHEKSIMVINNSDISTSEKKLTWNYSSLSNYCTARPKGTFKSPIRYHKRNSDMPSLNGDTKSK